VTWGEFEVTGRFLVGDANWRQALADKFGEVIGFTIFDIEDWHDCRAVIPMHVTLALRSAMHARRPCTKA
jgi:hypothetical protein